MKKINFKYVILFIVYSFSINFAFAWNYTSKADTIYDYLNTKYQSFTIEEQEQKRETMKSLFYEIQRKTDNNELLNLIDILMFKAERKINALKEYRNQYPNWNDDLNNIEQMRSDMLIQINQERLRLWISSLSLNNQLSSSAQLHAEYMAKTNDFAHTTKAWLKFDTRIRNAGYNWTYMWENIAWNQKTVNQVMGAWMNSPWHKDNILDKNFKEIGIWLSDYYRVQNFGTK